MFDDPNARAVFDNCNSRAQAVFDNRNSRAQAEFDDPNSRAVFDNRNARAPGPFATIPMLGPCLTRAMRRSLPSSGCVRAFQSPAKELKLNTSLNAQGKPKKGNQKDNDKGKYSEKDEDDDNYKNALKEQSQRLVTFETLVTFLTIENITLNIHSDP